MTGPTGSGVVRSGWILKAGTSTPDLITIFVKPQLHAVVRLVDDIPNQALPKGTVGTIVTVFSEPEEAYEVSQRRWSRGGGDDCGGGHILAAGQTIIGTVAVGATVIEGGAAAIEQLARPNIGQVVTDGSGTALQTLSEGTGPGRLLSPVANEAIEAWKASGSGQALQTWVNNQLRSGK